MPFNRSILAVRLTFGVVVGLGTICLMIELPQAPRNYFFILFSNDAIFWLRAPCPYALQANLVSNDFRKVAPSPPTPPVWLQFFQILIFSENVPGCHSIDPGAIGSRVTVQIEVFSLYLTFVHFVGISRAQILSGG